MKLLITYDALAPGQSQTKPTSSTTHYRATNYTDPAPSTQVFEASSLDSGKGSSTARRSQSGEEVNLADSLPQSEYRVVASGRMGEGSEPTQVWKVDAMDLPTQPGDPELF